MAVGLRARGALLLLGGALVLPAVPRVHAQAPAGGPPPSRPARVVTDISGFHLDRQSAAKSPNQIGAASRGAVQVLTLCAPVLGLASNPRPLFEWRTPEGTQQLTFSLLSDGGDVLYEGSVTGTSLEYPADAPPLEAGKTYSWKVSGGGVDKLPDPATFSLQEKAARDVLVKKLGSPEAADPLARVQLLLQQQLWYDAVAAARQSTRSDVKQQLQIMYKQVAPSCAE